MSFYKSKQQNSDDSDSDEDNGMDISVNWGKTYY